MHSNTVVIGLIGPKLLEHKHVDIAEHYCSHIDAKAGLRGAVMSAELSLREPATGVSTGCLRSPILLLFLFRKDRSLFIRNVLLIRTMLVPVAESAAACRTVPLPVTPCPFLSHC